MQVQNNKYQYLSLAPLVAQASENAVPGVVSNYYLSWEADPCGRENWGKRAMWTQCWCPAGPHGNFTSW